ncbi:MAG: hypothetical protein EHM40_05555 [Chloroflexi bacterium]|nr:MAG: hypothetical protein EHM40_05555 [Chloroflexota bacterium]
MSQKTLSILFMLMALMSLAVVTVSIHTPAQAQTLPTRASKNNCSSCHENLYFLHDTGNWFCLRESPMTCVDCHGGDPKAVTQELAHSNRAAHPVINEDVSKCQECHPEECDERVEIFDQTAGISLVRVAAPYTPVHSTERTDNIADAAQTEEQSGGLLLFWEIIPLVVIAGLALITYLIRRALHNKFK